MIFGIGYFLVAAACVVPFARGFMRFMERDFGTPNDETDTWFCCLFGTLLALGWPLALVLHVVRREVVQR